MIKLRQFIFAAVAVGLVSCQSQERANVIRPEIKSEVVESVAEKPVKKAELTPAKKTEKTRNIGCEAIGFVI